LTTALARRTLTLLIYLLPALADMVAAQFIFISAVRVARMGASASLVANTFTTWSVLYLLACPVIGRFVTRRNAARMMLAGMAGLALVSVLFAVVSTIAGIYVLMGIIGITTALFFLPFQVFMKAVDGADNRSIAYSTGMYTFAWSLGYAAGPFVSGLFMEFGSRTPGHGLEGWQYACLFAAAASLLAAGGIHLLRHLAVVRPATETGTAPDAAPEAQADDSRQPDLAWLGWVGGGVGVAVLAIIRGVFPSRAEACLHLSQGTQGTLFFTLYAAQALTGLALCRSRHWMYRASAVAGFGVLGVAGLLAYGFGTSPITLYAGAISFGVFAGSFFFYLVYHALVHPRLSSRYVSVNESLVGICSMIGASAGGWMADRYGFGEAYAGGAILLIAALAFQAAMHRRHPAR